MNACYVRMLCLGALVVLLSVGCGDVTVYKDCGDPGPHKFIGAGSYSINNSSADSLETPLPWAHPGSKKIEISDDVETMTMTYTTPDGREVVETWRIKNKRSNYDEW